jgi:hypothetical protein
MKIKRYAYAPPVEVSNHSAQARKTTSATRPAEAFGCATKPTPLVASDGTSRSLDELDWCGEPRAALADRFRLLEQPLNRSKRGWMEDGIGP